MSTGRDAGGVGAVRAEAGAQAGALGAARPTRNPIVAGLRLLAYAGLALCAPFLLSLGALVLGLCFLGVGLALVPWMAGLVRAYARLHRGLAWRWSAGAVPEHYLPPATGPGGWGGSLAVLRGFADPTVRRDWLFVLSNAVVGLVLCLLAPALALEGAWMLVAAGLWDALGVASWDNWFGSVYTGWPESRLILAVSGAAYLCAGLALAVPLLRGMAAWIRVSLTSPEGAALRARVAQLEATRRDAVTLQHEEIKRIERNLHDGTQARLVGVGLNIARAQQLIHTDPEEAARLLEGAKGQSTEALDELRTLVRGIRPPILADRGLTEALKALAVSLPIDTVVRDELVGRLSPAIENAAYFAAAELLANAVKHAQARTIRVRLWTSGEALHLSVEDDGRGLLAAAVERGPVADGAAPGGLMGLRQRLAALDGTLSLEDRQGQGTVANVSIPLPLS